MYASVYHACDDADLPSGVGINMQLRKKNIYVNDTVAWLWELVLVRQVCELEHC